MDFEPIEKFVRRTASSSSSSGRKIRWPRGWRIAFRPMGVKVFGPTKEAAQIEADKWFAKELMRQQAVPTAEARSFTDPDAAEEYVRMRDEPVVIKAAGLAKGKGVTRLLPHAGRAGGDRPDHAQEGLRRRRRRVVIEEMLTGPECSILAFVDRKSIYVMESAQDHKPVDDGDTGPMTGGMGAYSPTPVVTDAMLTPDRARHPRPGRRRTRSRGHRVQGRALRGADAHHQRAEGAGVQLPLRRPGNPAADDAAQERPARGDARGRRRQARPDRAEVGPAAGAVRRRDQQGLSGQVPDRPADHRHREGRLDARRESLPQRHQDADDGKPSSPTAAACWASPRWATRSRRPSSRAYERDGA